MKLRMLLPLFLLLSACSSSPDKKPLTSTSAVKQDQTNQDPSADKPGDCISGDGSVVDDKNYQIIIRNKCDSQFGGFSVEIRFYDATNTRIGWTQTEVHAIGKNENVKWTDEIKDDTLQVKDIKPSKITAEFVAMLPEIKWENK